MLWELIQSAFLMHLYEYPIDMFLWRNKEKNIYKVSRYLTYLELWLAK